MSSNSQKRKPASAAAAPPAGKRPRFQRPHHHITAGATATLYPHGELNVKSFLNSHEKEITALENAMTAAKKGLSRRAFQDVPRELRRRTASHNPQRVPKRLRVRAKIEAKVDNTPFVRGKGGSGVGKGKKAWLRKEGRAGMARWEERRKRRMDKDKDKEPPMEGVEVTKSTKQTSLKIRSRFPKLATPQTPPSRFRRRQKDKTWLPTHLWHAKRARMTPPAEPLWRFAIPLAPVMKAYRLTHRAAALRGAVTWDMSYMATIGLEGLEASIVGLLEGLHFAEEGAEDLWENRARAKKWRQGTRVWEGWLYEREPRPLRALAHVTVIWSVSDGENDKRKMFIRVHPSAFLQLWNEVIRVSKVQKPAVTVEDLRFEIGSIEIMGPAAAEALCSVLDSTPSADSSPAMSGTALSSLAGVTDPSMLPPGALLAYSISDPRLRDPPAATRPSHDPESQANLIRTLAEWSADAVQTSPALFNRTSRLAAGRSLPSQKSINRRKSACTLGEYPEPRATDAQIPTLVFVSRRTKSWTVLLPWKCVAPVWRGITRYPVSTGGNPRFGGLKERRQVDFERSVPSFPFDFPGTDAGFGWELQERAVREREWKKRPKGKRVEWTSVDLGGGRRGEVGDPWACAWERLLPDASTEVSGDAGSKELARSPYGSVLTQDVADLLSGSAACEDVLTVPRLLSVKLSMVQRGVPTTCARVYRLPTNNPALRSKWLSVDPKSASAKASKSTAKARTQQQRVQDGNAAEAHVRTRMLARSLLSGPKLHHDGESLEAGDEGHAQCPDEEDLIGFVTTGNYNLAEGRPTAIASIALHRVLDGKLVGGGGRGLAREGCLCIVREAGRSIGRLALWEVV